MKIVNSLSIATQPMASNPIRISSWLGYPTLLTEGISSIKKPFFLKKKALASQHRESKIAIKKTTAANTANTANTYNAANAANARVGLTDGKKWYLIEEIQKLLISYFKSIYSLIGKAKFKFFPNKIAIEILYYITIPDANIFTWYNLINKVDRTGSLSVGSVTCFAKTDCFATVSLASPKRATEQNISVCVTAPMGIKRKNKLIKLLKKNKLKYPNFEGKGATNTSELASCESNRGINFFKLNLNSINYLYSNKFKSLLFFFNKILNKPIELDLIRLHHSDSDSNILAQLFLLVLKKKNIRSVINKLYNKNKVKKINLNNWNVDSLLTCEANATNEQLAILPKQENKMNKLSKSVAKASVSKIPVFISGLYIHIGGRLMREPIIPRLTTKKFEKGAIALGKVDSLEKTQVTKKNKKGAYTIKIFFAQNIIAAR